MSNIQVGVGKKGIILALVIGVLLLGGGGGYLLWRVNQQDTVAPTDSGASEYEGIECIDYDTDCNYNGAYPKVNGQCTDERTAGICQYPYQNFCCRYQQKLVAYNITFSAGSGGTVSPSGKQSVKPNGGISSTATPNSGYKFVRWDGSGGGTVGDKTSPTLTINSVNSDATYTAIFEALPIEQFTLTYIAGTGGTITGTTPKKVNKGASGTAVTATPNTGYTFEKWSDGKTTASRTDTNVQANATYTAVFQQDAGYTLGILVSPAGSGKVFDGDGNDITGKTYQNLTPGSQIWNRAAPNSGYKFVKWQDGKTDNPRVELINSNMVLTAIFEALPADKVTLTYVAGAGGKITGTTTQIIDKGASGTAVTATPNTGYAFEKWSDGKTIATRTDTNVQASATYTATFRSTSPTDPVNCTGFTLSCGANNTININWNLVSGAIKYIARINKAPKGDWLNEAGGDVWISLSEDVNSYVIQNAQPGVVYGVNVLAYSGPDGQKDFHPSCNMTSLGQIWDPPMYLEISCQGTTPIVIPGNGTVPDTGIFDDSKNTVIFGFVILIIGLAWTWVSTLPEKAYSVISSTGSEMKKNMERRKVESRRSRLEKRIK